DLRLGEYVLEQDLRLFQGRSGGLDGRSAGVAVSRKGERVCQKYLAQFEPAFRTRGLGSSVILCSPLLEVLPELQGSYRRGERIIQSARLPRGRRIGELERRKHGMGAAPVSGGILDGCPVGFPCRV